MKHQKDKQIQDLTISLNKKEVLKLEKSDAEALEFLFKVLSKDGFTDEEREKLKKMDQDKYKHASIEIDKYGVFAEIKLNSGESHIVSIPFPQLQNKSSEHVKLKLLK